MHFLSSNTICEHNCANWKKTVCPFFSAFLFCFGFCRVRFLGAFFGEELEKEQKLKRPQDANKKTASLVTKKKADNTDIKQTTQT